jgi:hypothetical protein
MTTPSETPPETTAPPPVMQALQNWVSSLRVVFGRALSIAVLETRLAALNFVLILIIGVASGLLLATAWIALFAAIVGWFHTLGLSWPLSFLLMAAINFLFAALGGYAIYRMSNNLLFKTLRQFILAVEFDKDDSAAIANRDQQSSQ